MQRYKVGIAGYFATGKSKAGGQEAKTCSIDRALKSLYGEDTICNVDTTDWKKNPFRLFWGLVCLVLRCDNIVILPAQKSLKIFLPVLLPLNRIFHRKIFYSVVGGWMPDMAKDNSRLQLQLKKLDAIYVETTTMQHSLEALGITNVTVIPNFKDLDPVRTEELDYRVELPLKVCTFSRIMKEKGIEDAIRAVTEINEQYGKEMLRLDLYGKIDDGYLDEFQHIQSEFPSYITYKGMVEPHESVTTLKEYFALLFPTHYYTEGVPGTIIDAYMSGVPVISAVWGNAAGVLFEGVTSWGYAFNNYEALKQALTRLIEHPDEFVLMRSNCVAKARMFRPESSVKVICDNFA